MIAMHKKTHTLSLVFALLASAIFGMSFMFSKLALEVAKPTVLLAFRFLIAFTAMSLVILVNALVGKTRGRPLFAFSLKGKRSMIQMNMMSGKMQKLQKMSFRIHLFSITHIKKSLIQKNISVPG